MKRDFDAMEADFGSLKEKLEASKARNKVLANENKTHKEQIKTLLEKGKHDDELIEALLVLKITLTKNQIQNKIHFNPNSTNGTSLIPARIDSI